MPYKLVVAIVRRGMADNAIDAARAAGIDGATVLLARGTSIHQPAEFLGIRVTSEHEVVLVLCPEELTDAVLGHVVSAAELEKSGMGVAFVVDVARVVGIVHREHPAPSGTDG